VEAVDFELQIDVFTLALVMKFRTEQEYDCAVTTFDAADILTTDW
jgi:hypothetical protein